MSEPSYEDVPYEGSSIAATAPAALALTSRAHGGPRPSLSGARVLELGCGDGANLLALAFHHREQSFVGIDASAAAIAAAERDARELELANVRFECADVGALELEGPFDFVIAHGLYSWIDASRRAALRRLVRRVLAPSGLAYVSFNAQPGWGVRGRVRDVLARASLDVDAARARAAGLRGILGEPGYPWAGLLAHELDRASEASEAYLAHEYLAAHNDAFWLGELTRDFASEGLRYVGDALFDRPEGYVSPELRQAVAELAHDPIEREELIDLLAYRQLRAAVLCRDDAPTSPPLDASIIDEVWIASSVRAVSEPFDLAPDAEEPFVGPRGTEVRARAPLAKMGLLLLASRYPEGFRLDALCAEAEAALRRYGMRAGPDERDILRGGLFALWQRMELELRMEDAALRTTPGPRPLASALTRHEAVRGRHLTTPTHVALPIEPLERAIVAELDGTRTVPELVDALVASVEAGRVELEGAPSGAARLAPLLAERIEPTLTTLGWWGLVR
jgi:SAM-dependent methyltransferase